jgi:hypothetical protein
MFSFFGSFLHEAIVLFVGLATSIGLVSATPQATSTTLTSSASSSEAAATSSSPTYIPPSLPIQKASTTPSISRVIVRQSNNTKSDSFVVTHDADDNPITWDTLDSVAIILSSTLETYTTSLATIQQVQNTEKNTLSSMYGTLPTMSSAQSKSQMLTLISYDEAYITSGENLIELLTNLVQSYQGYLTVIQKRDLQLYSYYSGQVDMYEAQKATTLNDYTAKQAAKQDYAKSLLIQ